MHQASLRSVPFLSPVFIDSSGLFSPIFPLPLLSVLVSCRLLKYPDSSRLFSSLPAPPSAIKNSGSCTHRPAGVKAAVARPHRRLRHLEASARDVRGCSPRTDRAGVRIGYSVAAVLHPAASIKSGRIRHRGEQQAVCCTLYAVLYAGCWVLGAGCWMRVRGARYGVQRAEWSGGAPSAAWPASPIS